MINPPNRSDISILYSFTSTCCTDVKETSWFITLNSAVAYIERNILGNPINKGSSNPNIFQKFSNTLQKNPMGKNLAPCTLFFE